MFLEPPLAETMKLITPWRMSFRSKAHYLWLFMDVVTLQHTGQDLNTHHLWNNWTHTIYSTIWLPYLCHFIWIIFKCHIIFLGPYTAIIFVPKSFFFLELFPWASTHLPAASRSGGRGGSLRRFSGPAHPPWWRAAGLSRQTVSPAWWESKQSQLPHCPRGQSHRLPWRAREQVAIISCLCHLGQNQEQMLSVPASHSRKN